MPLEKSFSNSNVTALTRSRSINHYAPVKRSRSTTDLSASGGGDVIDFCRPWYSKKHTGSNDDFWFYKLFYGAKPTTTHYHRSHRLSCLTDPTYTRFSSLDPLSYRRIYYSNYANLYPSKWWLTPAFYESKFYDVGYRPYSWYPYSWYYPRRYHYQYYY